MSTIATMGVTPGTTAAPGRMRLTMYALAQVGLAVPALGLLVVDLVGGALALIVIGIPLLLGGIPATRWVANCHRSMAGRVLGTPIPRQYRPSRAGGPVARLAGWAADPMTWRDVAWLAVACTAGFAIALVAVLLLVVVVTGGLWWFGIEPIMRARSAMDRWFPANRRVTIKNAGHWVHSEQPEVFVEVLRQFLA